MDRSAEHGERGLFLLSGTHSGRMFRLGVAGDQVGHAPLHTSTFDIDERALAIGASYLPPPRSITLTRTDPTPPPLP